MFCRYYQWIIEKTLDDTRGVSSPRLQGHLNKCPRCRSYYQNLLRLSDQLPAAMNGHLTNAQSRKIQTAVRQALSDEAMSRIAMNGLPKQSTGYFITAVRSAAAVLIVAALAGLFFYANRPAGDPSQTSELMNTLSANSRQIQNRAALLIRLPEQSMQTEMQNLTLDARQAAAFLLDCVPGMPTAPQTNAHPGEPAAEQ